LFFSRLMRDSSRASNFQCSATLSYALLMDGSVACVARCLASSAFRRQVSLSDDIRGGSSNASNQEEKPRRMRGLKTVMHGATPGTLNPSPPPFTFAGQHVQIGGGVGRFWGKLPRA